MNEPAEALTPNVHVATLAESSQQHAMLKALAKKPRYGLTLGMADILRSRRILLLVNGKPKRPALRRLMKTGITTRFPASFLCAASRRNHALRSGGGGILPFLINPVPTPQLKMQKQPRINSQSTGGISRRSFLAAAGAVTTFMALPPHVLGRAGEASPNSKLNIAGVGFGGQGASDLEEVSSQNIVALCDVDWDYAAKTFKQYPAAKRYKDFRQMLDKEKSIDAVVVATPDHNHAIVSITAIKHGKHVYCEKPLTRTVYEARAVAKGGARGQSGHADGQPGHGVRGQPADQ